MPSKKTHPPDFLQKRLLYRDGLILVIDKPAGIPVHGGPNTRVGQENLEQYFDALRFGLPRPPALAHRLDRDTTGCLVLGRHPKAIRKLGRLFSEGRVGKLYWAICKGSPEKPSGTISSPLVKKMDKSDWRVVTATMANPDAQAAATTYRTIAVDSGLSFIEAKPKTGRTHQIRVHLASIGAPILGDPLYGDLAPEDRAGPMMLHARRVVIPMSKNKGAISVEAPPPTAMVERLKDVGAAGVIT